MSYDLYDFHITTIGQILKVGDKQFGWVKIYFGLTDPATFAHPYIDINVPISYETDWSIGETHQAAFDKALETLKTAVSHFEKDGLQGLKELHDEFVESGVM